MADNARVTTGCAEAESSCQGGPRAGRGHTASAWRLRHCARRPQRKPRRGAEMRASRARSGRGASASRPLIPGHTRREGPPKGRLQADYDGLRPESPLCKRRNGAHSCERGESRDERKRTHERGHRRDQGARVPPHRAAPAAQGHPGPLPGMRGVGARCEKLRVRGLPALALADGMPAGGCAGGRRAAEAQGNQGVLRLVLGRPASRAEALPVGRMPALAVPSVTDPRAVRPAGKGLLMHPRTRKVVANAPAGGASGAGGRNGRPEPGCPSAGATDEELPSGFVAATEPAEG